MSKLSVYIGSLSTETTEQTLKTLFFSCGDIVKVTLLKHPDTGISRGFGFIEFLDNEAINNALLLNGTTIDGHKIKVSHPTNKR